MKMSNITKSLSAVGAQTEIQIDGSGISLGNWKQPCGHMMLAPFIVF